jgi:hypothetical protein
MCRAVRKIGDGICAATRSVLQEGLAPEKVALTICLGGAVGILPIAWGTTLLCAALAARFRLNQAAIQAVNYLVYPLQMVLFFPFIRLGARYLPWGPAVSADVLKGALSGRFQGSVTVFCWAALKAACAWLVTVPVLALLLYPLLLSILRRRRHRSLTGELAA